jgi:hypothetical protein
MLIKAGAVRTDAYIVTKKKGGGWIRSHNVTLSLALTTYAIKLLVIRNCVQLYFMCI